MRPSPRVFWNLKFRPGTKLNPAPLAYDTGPWQGGTTIARKKFAQGPETSSLPGGWGCVKTGIRDQGSGIRKEPEH
jgi:hypothetical protein